MGNSYKDIVKTTGLLGFVKIITIILSAINNKILAIYVGTAGYGIYGMYQIFISTLSSFSILGLDQSGVREIAKMSEDEEQVAKCIWTLKRIVLSSSLLVSVVSMLFSKTISNNLFDSDEHYIGIIIVSFAVLFNNISTVQMAILNGFRKITNMVKSQLIGSVIGSIATILSVMSLKDKGIPLYLFIISLCALITTFWYVRDINLKQVKLTISEIKGISKSLIIAGFGFLVPSLVFAITTYLSRIYLLDNFSLSGVGMYTASWALSNLYIGIILSAMGVDFMPRIMKCIDDNKKLNKMISEQMEFGVLASGFAVVGVILFSSLILNILYSAEFIAASSIIIWQTLGVALRVVSYPLGFVIMGKNKPMTYIAVQVSFFVCELLLLILFGNYIGFDGLGVNYFIAYMLYVIVTLVIMKKISNFKVSKLFTRLFVYEWAFIILSLAVVMLFKGVILWSISAVILIIMLWHTNRSLVKYMNINVLNIILIKLKNG